MDRITFTTSLLNVSYETSPAKAGHPPEKCNNIFCITKSTQP